MTRFSIGSLAAVSAFFLLALTGSAQNSGARLSRPSILPEQFAGWQRQGTVMKSADPAQADPANSEVLKEFSFTDLEVATYQREDGRTLKIRAARFADASGAFGAYTFYRVPAMAREAIGDQAASASPRVLFSRGHILVDAVFSGVTPMSPSELRELAAGLPRPAGNAGNLPPVRAYLPKREFNPDSEKYAEGPRALGQYGAPLPVELVDFSVSPEVSVGEYATPSGPATLMLLYYPTPQLAAEHLRRIDAAQASAGVSGRIFDRRSGPIVAVVAGAASERDARVLLGAVNYEASITWNENTYFDKKDNAANLIFNGILLAIFITGASLIFGIFFGGFRIVMKRLYPGRVFDRPQQMEIIRLNLDGPADPGSPRTGDVT
jgi:hypothetical protein